ncbi:MAG: hypothetical protein RR906_05390, partial [Acetivibrio sp.]
MPKKKVSTQQTALIVLFIVFLLSILPLYYIGIYAHPSADDYSYGVRSLRIWEGTHSLSAVFDSALTKTLDKYLHWQGNFIAIFLMYLQPSIFGEKYYFFTPFLLLTTFILFSFFFHYTVFRKIVKSNPCLSSIASLLLIFFALEFTPVPSDSFYWYNGGIYYTFFYALSLLLYGAMIQLYFRKRTLSKLALAFCCMILSFCLGGSNYATALLNVILLFFTLLGFAYKRNFHFFYWLPIFLSGFCSLFISMNGPGNMLRQSTIGDPHHPIPSILLSFIYGGYSIVNATTVPILLFWFLMMPIFWKMLKNVKFSFNQPFFVFFMSFCIYSAQITPVIFAQGIRIPYRIRNIVYFNYYIFIAFNLFYLLGYLKYHQKLPQLSHPFSLKLYYISLALAISAFCLGNIKVSETANKEIELSNLPFTASAVYSLVTKEAQLYDKEADARAHLLRNSEEKDITLIPFQNTPYVLFHTDITQNPDY